MCVWDGGEQSQIAVLSGLTVWCHGAHALILQYLLHKCCNHSEEHPLCYYGCTHQAGRYSDLTV